MITPTNNFKYDSDFDDYESHIQNNISCSLFYTPLIAGFTVSACMWLFNNISDYLFDDSIY